MAQDQQYEKGVLSGGERQAAGTWIQMVHAETYKVVKLV